MQRLSSGAKFLTSVHALPAIHVDLTYLTCDGDRGGGGSGKGRRGAERGAPGAGKRTGEDQLRGEEGIAEKSRAEEQRSRAEGDRVVKPREGKG